MTALLIKGTLEHIAATTFMNNQIVEEINKLNGYEMILQVTCPGKECNVFLQCSCMLLLFEQSTKRGRHKILKFQSYAPFAGFKEVYLFLERKMMLQLTILSLFA